MINRMVTFLKTHPIQSVLLVMMAVYFAVYAYTGSCPMQLMGDKFAAKKALNDGDLKSGGEPGSAVFNLYQAALDFEGVDGRVINTSSFSGKVTVVNYWATWCGPCVREIPAFNKISVEQPEDVQFIGISLDSDVKAVHQFFKRTPIAYPVVHGDMRLTQLTGPIRSIPTTLFFNREGNYAGKVVGSMHEQQLLKKIESL